MADHGHGIRHRHCSGSQFAKRVESAEASDSLNNIGEAHMKIRSWMVRGWPTVTWQAPEDISAFPAFNHMSTEIRAEPGPLGHTTGDTVWATDLGAQGMLAIAWEWTEVMPGVLVISDPNGLISNARFVTDDGQEQDELVATLTSNLIIHNTAWQTVVMSQLRKGDALAGKADAAAVISLPRTDAVAVSASMRQRRSRGSSAHAAAAQPSRPRSRQGLPVVAAT
jgi:hypothetical protein